MELLLDRQRSVVRSMQRYCKTAVQDIQHVDSTEPVLRLVTSEPSSRRIAGAISDMENHDEKERTRNEVQRKDPQRAALPEPQDLAYAQRCPTREHRPANECRVNSSKITCRHLGAPPPSGAMRAKCSQGKLRIEVRASGQYL